jgi:NAD(P)-dependent dehydrogenase (short-subunit alcohol dehydrogenase family)
MAGQLEGKIALVTGGSSGIGRATALAFAREGASVMVADVNVEGGEATARSVQEAGGRATFARADVARATEVEALIGRAVETYGRLDCAFNNAGVGGYVEGASFHTYPEEAWDRVIDINLKAVWLCMKYEIAQMLDQGGGAIVNTASIWGLLGGGGLPAYVASKHGVVGLTRRAAIEYARQHIRVNAVCPGFIRTPMTEPRLAANPDLEAHWSQLEPVGRIGAPEEVAEAVVWLCSDAASFVTGHPMAVDGGFAAQ